MMRVLRLGIAVAFLVQPAMASPDSHLVYSEPTFSEQAFVLPVLQFLKTYSVRQRVAAVTLAAAWAAATPVWAQTPMVYSRPGVSITMGNVPGSKNQITPEEFSDWKSYFGTVPADHLALVKRVLYGHSKDELPAAVWGSNGVVRLNVRPGSIWRPNPDYEFDMGLAQEVFKYILTDEERREWVVLAGRMPFENEYPLWTGRERVDQINNALKELIKKPGSTRLIRKALFMAALFREFMPISAHPGELQVGSYHFHLDERLRVVGVDLPRDEIRRDDFLLELPEKRILFDPVELPNALLKLIQPSKTQAGKNPQRHLLTAA